MRRVINLCKQVPLLPITILAAIPLAMLGTWRPWGTRSVFAMLFGWDSVNPGVGQWLVIALVLYTIIVTVLGMIDDVRHGHVGVDLLAVIAIASTLAVQEYWAAWAVVLMISSGEAIEEFAQSKAESNLTALIEAAPRTAHVVRLPGMRGHVHASGTEHASDISEDGFRRAVTMSDSGESDTGAPKAYDASGEHFTTISVDDVKLGDVLLVLPGETVPVDGELLSGAATLDLSNINGEPLPREIYAGARVMSGAVNGSTTLTMRATQLAHDSQYQKILELVSSAQDSRPAVVKTADVLAVPFTVLSLAIAVLAWIIAGTPLRFAQVLVLATPCPLLIAAPVAYVAGTGRLAKAGILIKAQDVLENLGRVTHIFFDKTGTLTVKQPQVVRVELAMHDLYARYAAGQRLCAERNLPGHGRDYPVVNNIVEDAGKGVSGEVNGHKVRVGRYAYATADEFGFSPVVHVSDSGESDKRGTSTTLQMSDSPESDNMKPGTSVQVSDSPESDMQRIRNAGVLSDSPESDKRAVKGRLDVNSRFAPLEPDEMAAYVALDGQLAARIVLRDVPRKNAKNALARLRELGVGKLSMLTGDKAASARIIAEEVGIDDVHSELFPEDKVRAVKDASEATRRHRTWWDGFTGESRIHQVTMMVGDGVNDAPVLAAADIGMAMTDGTSTAASESAQVVIMNDDIASVPRAIAIARRTKKVMLQAVLVGLGLAVIGMIAAAFNLIPVVVGAFMQEGIDVVSILWALTALWDRE